LTIIVTDGEDNITGYRLSTITEPQKLYQCRERKEPRSLVRIIHIHSRIHKHIQL